eukprot:scaffold111105_cov53-Phaeocystis_antarctica.AAC.1
MYGRHRLEWKNGRSSERLRRDGDCCRAAHVPGRSHGRVEEGMEEARAGLAPTARGHAARDLQSEMPHTRGIPCDNAERTERHQREGGRPQD